MSILPAAMGDLPRTPDRPGDPLPADRLAGAPVDASSTFHSAAHDTCLLKSGCPLGCRDVCWLAIRER